ncbi:GAF domain-containing protein [Streptomyces sp. G-G2]|uniref:GAF domain-containing protein n=1 Tax=Streptomyces sp. G-G2 TaxID=3046201 RepID=UPI0024B8A818|nr:GAF domain-containing protein [Streptomyces sp. G-G2]MDJ0383550.1 GAF domain-containing protein [Streptomyces sp. G-G2]
MDEAQRPVDEAQREDAVGGASPGGPAPSQFWPISGQDRTAGLLEAVLSVDHGLDLPQALHRIVEAAVGFADAEYGALGVIGDDARLVLLVTAGVSAGGAGAFLGVPVRGWDGTLGSLYLRREPGAREFGAEDGRILSILATAAGVAIENARLNEQARYRERWIEANSEIVSTLLSGADEETVLQLIVDRAGQILDAGLGVVALTMPGTDELHVALASGVDADEHRGLTLPREGSFAGAALVAHGPITSLAIGRDPRTEAGAPRWAGLGPAVGVPMGGGERVRGALLLARAEGLAPFTPAETAPLMAFAGQAALAMELGDRRWGAEQLALLEDRDRIARDLHDLAIQRLFATGMTLQSAVRFVEHPQASERLLRAVDDLDETIKIIRSTIFGLRAQEGPRSQRSLRARTAAALERSAPALGFTPALRMEGLIDTDVPPEAGDHVVAVLSEALTNVTRHAQATAVDVTLVVRSGTLTLTVADNGKGMPGSGRRSGLRNLAERAEALGGEMSVGNSPQGGTRLVWQVPNIPG